ncbi:MAG: PilT/PilU family type 4a pilus ATPase [Deltaproteobacteria bacterium]|nr:PilT/PilU family type 4a pilus ATPase [Deltaproteobacteria bacterium]
MEAPKTDSPPIEQMVAKLLQAAVALRASDLHLRAGLPPFVRVDGALSRTNGGAVTAELLEEIIAVTSGRDPSGATVPQWEYSYESPGLVRLRGHVFREGGQWALALRVIPFSIPAFGDLRLPPVVKTLSELGSGLVLVTGPTGSGKSTTMASMLHHLASHDTVHLVSLEDPVEFRIANVPSCISQREIGRDTPSLEEGLRALLREDPDVIFISEIRDLAALDVALQAAETGHSVYATFHTGTALKTLQRMIGMFPADEQVAARARLADSLRGVISQALLPRKGSRGRVLCTEVLVNNYSVKDCIRDPARTPAIQAVLDRSTDQQMHAFDHCLASLVRDGLVAPDVALSHAVAPADFRRLLNFPGLQG